MMKTLRSLFNFIQKNKWYLIAVLWLAGLGLGYAGFSTYALQEGTAYTWLDKIYMTIQLVVLESGPVTSPPPALNVARFLLPFLTAQTSLMALAGIFTREVRQFNLRFARNHIIICGNGTLAFFAARAVMRHGSRVALVTNSTNENEKRAFEELGGVAIEGNLADPDIAKQVALLRAGHLLSFYDDDIENIENALLVDKITAHRRKGTLQCITHLNDPLLSNLFLEQMLKAEWKERIQHDVINIYEQAASLVLRKHPAIDPDFPEKTAPFLIIGFDEVGQHILLESVRSLAAASGKHEVKIHVLDKEASWKCIALHKRYLQMEKVCCITAHDIDIYSSAFQDTRRFLSEYCPDVRQIYICLNDDLQAINTALTIYRQLQAASPQIILRLSEAKGVKDLFHYAEKIEKIRVVPIYAEIGSPSVLLNSSVELLARAFHEHYIQERLEEKAVGPAFVEWSDLDEEKKESNRNLARFLKQHLSFLQYQLIPQQGLKADPFTFSTDEIEFLAKKEHERWVAETLAKGWRYGPQNDPKKKTNPDLQPWENLSDAEKQFNREFIRIVPELVARVRLQIVSRTPDGSVPSQRTVRIGVSGHLFLSEPAAVQKAIKDVLEKIGGLHTTQEVRLYSPLAPGADQLAGISALDQKIPVVVLIPFDEEQYIRDFPDTDQDTFLRLSKQAAEFICLGSDEDKDAAFRELGSYLVDHMDYLIVVWNGRPERGPGGTGEVVEKFRQTGKPLAWIRADNMLPENPVLLPASLKQGSIAYENW